jgi:hypothetical protein
VRWLLLFAVACSKEEPRKQVAETPPPGPRVLDAAPAAADAPLADPSDAMPMPRIDAGVADYSQLVTAEWPTAMEVEMVSRNGKLAHGTIDMTYPRFRIRPKALGDELAAKFAEAIARGDDPHGAYTLQCELVTTSRIAVIVRCGSMFDTSGECVNCGGAPAGPHPMMYAYWLQPGLPPITLDQIAPGIDIAKLIADANKIDTNDCRMSACELSPQHFVIGVDGITLAPGEYCTCSAESFPVIPLAELKPTHPWAVKWLAWVRQRVDQNETLVKYVR